MSEADLVGNDLTHRVRAYGILTKGWHVMRIKLSTGLCGGLTGLSSLSRSMSCRRNCGTSRSLQRQLGAWSSSMLNAGHATCLDSAENWLPHTKLRDAVLRHCILDNVLTCRLGALLCTAVADHPLCRRRHCRVNDALGGLPKCQSRAAVSSMLTGHAGGADGTWSSSAPSKVPHTPLRGHSMGVSSPTSVKATLTRGLLEGGLHRSGGGGARA